MITTRTNWNYVQRTDWSTSDTQSTEESGKSYSLITKMIAEFLGDFTFVFVGEFCFVVSVVDNISTISKNRCLTLVSEYSSCQNGVIFSNDLRDPRIPIILLYYWTNSFNFNIDNFIIKMWLTHVV